MTSEKFEIGNTFSTEERAGHHPVESETTE
jgi:hypothetical protein